jgi:hypothetical protein
MRKKTKQNKKSICGYPYMFVLMLINLLQAFQTFEKKK